MTTPTPTDATRPIATGPPLEPVLSMKLAGLFDSLERHAFLAVVMIHEHSLTHHDTTAIIDYIERCTNEIKTTLGQNPPSTGSRRSDRDHHLSERLLGRTTRPTRKLGRR